MNVIYADEFRKQFNRLPAGSRRIFKKQEEIFIQDWRDKRLHLKKLKASPFFSFRVTRN